MKNHSLPLTVFVAAAAMFTNVANAQSLPPATKADMETVYTTAIENRTTDILKLLDLTDPAKSNVVHDIIIAVSYTHLTLPTIYSV